MWMKVVQALSLNSAPWWRLRSAPPSHRRPGRLRNKEWRAVADRLRERFPKLGALMDEAEDDVLAHPAFPKEHWSRLHSTNPFERLNGEIRRRTDVVAIFPSEAAIVRLVGALLLEQNDEWSRRPDVLDARR